MYEQKLTLSKETKYTQINKDTFITINYKNNPQKSIK